MRKYKKKPLTYTEQVILLQERGLIVNDISRAKRYLSEISYYRLSGYFLPYCESKDKFVEGATFDDILNLYLFDRDLRIIVFESWFHTLAYARDICAHHARLWNREFAIKPEVLKKPKHNWIEKSFNSNNHRCFYFLSMIKYLLISANPSNHFKDRLIDLFKKYPGVPIKFMGIPSDNENTLISWNEQLLWQ